MRPVKVMTYNIHSGYGRDRQYRLNRIIEVIRQEDPDVVALQEVENNLSHTNFENQSQIIARRLKMHFHHCINRYSENGEFGITTLSRFPIQRKYRHELSYRRRMEPRGSLRTDVTIDKAINLHIFNVHMGLSTRERVFQRKIMLSETVLLDDRLDDPIIVLGDFNDRPISVVHRSFRSHFDDVFRITGKTRGSTFMFGPFRWKLDHIYVSHNIEPLNAYVVNTPLSRKASDHLPLVAVLQLFPAGEV